MKKDFIDTIVFGVVFHKPYKLESLYQFKGRCRKEMESIWGIEKAYVSSIDVE